MATNAARESLAVNFTTLATHAALYTTIPTSTTMGTEVTGGTYARRPLTWTTGSSDGIVTASVTFNVPSGVTVKGAGVHSALTGTTNYVDGGAVAEIPFTSAGTYVLNLTFTVS